MEGRLLVDPKDLKNTASVFSNRAKTAKTLTDNMMSTVNSLKGAYEGDAANAYYKTFSSLQEDMNQIQRKIQEHVTDLNDMASNYESTENTATQANAALKSDYI